MLYVGSISQYVLVWAYLNVYDRCIYLIVQGRWGWGEGAPYIRTSVAQQCRYAGLF